VSKGRPCGHQVKALSSHLGDTAFPLYWYWGRLICNFYHF